MDPQQQPAIQPNSTPAPVPPAPETPPVPQPSPAPPTVQTPMPVTPTVVVPGPPLTLPQTGKKSRRGLILGIVGGIVVILVVIILLVALPNLQANKVSSNFMHDITAGNVSAAAALTDGGSSNNAFHNFKRRIELQRCCENVVCCDPVQYKVSECSRARQETFRRSA